MRKISPLKIELFITSHLRTSSKIITVTWLNHSSLLQLKNDTILLEEFNYIGIDGYFLKTLLGRRFERSSADLVIPKLLADLECKVFLVGGEELLLTKRLKSFMGMFPNAKVLLNISGYGADTESRILEASKIDMPDFIFLGLGAKKQEQIAITISQTIKYQKPTLIATCGGWLDQITVPNYYPKWAYPLKLNWLVRIVREPRRLWRRYTIDAVEILFKKTLLQKIKHATNVT